MGLFSWKKNNAVQADSTVKGELRFDGFYYHSGSSDGNKFIRFYPDGRVASVTSTGNPGQVSRWFDYDNKVVSRGTYSIRDGVLRFDTTSNPNVSMLNTPKVTVDYTGTVGLNALTLDSCSRYNGHTSIGVCYTFFSCACPIKG